MSTSPIVGFCGKRGSGKTLLCTSFVYKMVKKNMKAKVKTVIYSNYTIVFPKSKYIEFHPMSFETFDELFGPDKKCFDIWNALFVFDEISMWADSYNFSDPRVKKLCKYALQSRKRKVNIFYTAQFMALVPRRLRLATELVIDPEFKKKEDILIYTVNEWDGSGRYAINNCFIDKPSKYFGLYDTDMIIDFDE